MSNNEDIPQETGPENDAPDFEDFEGGEKSLADAWRDNPLVKVGIIVGGLAVVIGGVILFGGKKPPLNESKTAGGTQLTEAPGTSEVSEVYREAVQESDMAAVEQAIRTGGSVMPTPITPPRGQVTLPEDEPPEDDPLERWRRIQEDRQRKVEDAPPPPQGDPNADTIQSLAEAMAAQMESILQAKVPQPPKYAVITPPDEFSLGGDEEDDGEDDGETPDAEEVVDIILPAGTIEYAQLIIEADSDVPGPIMARILSGPLAGSKLIGSFEVQNEYLVLSFSTIVIDGVSQSVNSVALNPETTKIGMVTDVDHRYWERIILPAAASFIEGFGSAVAQTGSTTVNTGTGSTVQQEEDLNTREELLKGVEEAASSVSELLEEEADETEIRVRVRAGTPMGILFLDPVTKDGPTGQE